MKTKLTLIALVSFSIILKAQTTTNTNTLNGTIPNPTEFLGSSNNYDVVFKTNSVEKMRLLTTGNLGVGTNTVTPNVRVHIVGTMGFPATSGSAQTGILRLMGTGSNGVMDFSVNGGQAACIQVTNQTNLGLNYVLALNPNGGNVGIGTKTPSAKLEVFGGGIKVTGGGISATDPYVSSFYSMNFTRSAGFLNSPDIYGDGSNPLIIAGKADGTGITSFSGKVGIGTTTVTSGMVLDVIGGGINAANGYGSMFYGLSLTRSGLVGLPDISGDGTHPLLIAGKGDGTGITIISGNVGIGTSATYMNANTEQYKLAVNGKIGAKSIKVEISSGWADYVFEKNYKLKTISEMEDFIKKNQHLPNVPSASEVEKNGIDMATMDATLLSKIEELSLYIIELNKKIEALEQINIAK